MAHAPLLEGGLFLSVIRVMKFFTLRLRLHSTSNARISAFTSRVSTFCAYCFLLIRDVASCAVPMSVREHARSGGSVIYVYSVLFGFV